MEIYIGPVLWKEILEASIPKEGVTMLFCCFQSKESGILKVCVYVKCTSVEGYMCVVEVCKCEHEWYDRLRWILISLRLHEIYMFDQQYN